MTPRAISGSLERTPVAMNVSCSKCATRYTVPDEKVRGRKVRLPCRHCGTPIVIDGRDPGAGGPASRRGGPPSVPRPRSPATAGAAPQGASWSVSIGGEVKSMSLAEIADGFKAGRITPDTHVWRNGMAEWVALQSAAELTRELAKRGVDMSGGMSDAFGDDDDEATRMVDLSSRSLPRPSSPKPIAERKTPTDTTAPTPSPALASALPDDDEDEATAMFSPAAHGAPPAAAMADAIPDDEDEATQMYSAASHGPGPSLPDALPDDEEDEATRMFSPADHARADSLADALPDDDGEATKMYGPEDHDRVETTKPGSDGTKRTTGKRAKAKPAPPPRPISRAESAAAAPPPTATSRPGNDWEESSVIVEASAPEDNRLAISLKPEKADERTGRVKATAAKSSTLPIGTILLLIALALAAGASGYLISQRTQGARPPVPGPPSPSPLPDTETHRELPAQEAPEQGEEQVEQGSTEVEEETSEVEEAPAAPKRRATKAPKSRKPADTAPSEPPAKEEAEPAPPPKEEAEKAGEAAAKEAEPPAPPGPLDQSKARIAMAAAGAAAETQCSKPGEPNGSAIVTLSLVPSGKAVGISLKGPLSGTSTGLCILQRFARVSVPPFEGTTTQMTRTVRIE